MYTNYLFTMLTNCKVELVLMENFAWVWIILLECGQWHVGTVKQYLTNFQSGQNTLKAGNTLHDFCPKFAVWRSWHKLLKVSCWLPRVTFADIGLSELTDFRQNCVVYDQHIYFTFTTLLSKKIFFKHIRYFECVDFICHTFPNNELHVSEWVHWISSSAWCSVV